MLDDQPPVVVRASGMLHPRRALVLALALFAPSLACKSEDEPQQAPKALTLDISAIDPALTGKLMIDVPTGSKMELVGPGIMSIRGPQAGIFSVLVDVQPRDLDRERDNPDEIVLDEPDLVITNLKLSDEVSMLSFSANVKVGDRIFGCHQDTAAMLDRERIDAMVAACRTLRIE
jgi:hypothetical protein